MIAAVAAAMLYAGSGHGHQTSTHTGGYSSGVSTAAPSAPSGSRSHSTPPAQPKTHTVATPSKPCLTPVAKPHPIPAKPPVHTSPPAGPPVSVVVATTAPASGGIGTPVSISSPGPAALANTGSDTSALLALGSVGVLAGASVLAGARRMRRRGQL